MPTKGIRDLRKMEFCKQTDCATLGTVARRLVGQCGVIRNPSRVFPREATGLMSENILGRAYDTSLIGEGPLTPGEEGLTFQELTYYLGMGAVGGVSPTDADPVFTWDFCPDLVNGDMPDVITLIYGDNAAQWEGVCGFAKSLRLSGAFNAPWNLEADMVFQDWDNAAVAFEDLPWPSAYLDVMLGQKTRFYLDDSCHFLATPTRRQGYLIDWDILIPGFHPKFFADGSLSYTTMGLDSRHLEVVFTVEFDDDLAKAVIWDGYRDGTAIYIRLFAEGGNIPTDGVNFSATFDMVLEVKHAETLDERDGNDIIKFTGETVYDIDCDSANCAPTEGFEWAIQVVNNVSEIPACT